MNNVVGVAATGIGGTSAMLVGEGIVKVNIPSCASEKPSILMMDLTGGAFDYTFTIGNSLTAIGATLTVVSLYIAIRRIMKHDRRADD